MSQGIFPSLSDFRHSGPTQLLFTNTGECARRSAGKRAWRLLATDLVFLVILGKLRNHFLFSLSFFFFLLFCVIEIIIGLMLLSGA